MIIRVDNVRFTDLDKEEKNGRLDLLRRQRRRRRLRRIINIERHKDRIHGWRQRG